MDDDLFNELDANLQIAALQVKLDKALSELETRTKSRDALAETVVAQGDELETVKDERADACNMRAKRKRELDDALSRLESVRTYIRRISTDRSFRGDSCDITEDIDDLLDGRPSIELSKYLDSPAEYLADAWCTACIAREALSDG